MSISTSVLQVIQGPGGGLLTSPVSTLCDIASVAQRLHEVVGTVSDL